MDDTGREGDVPQVSQVKARPVSPYRAKIRALELEIEDLRRLDAEWRRDVRQKIVQAPFDARSKVARAWGYSPAYAGSVL